MYNKEKFYMVYVEGNSAPDRKHLVFADALEEANRLAIKYPTRLVHILASVEYFLAPEPKATRYTYI